MKALTTIILFFLAMNMSAQKTIYVFNSSNSDFDIGHVSTKSTNSSGYPKFTSHYNNTSSAGNYTVSAHTVAEFYAVPASNIVFPFFATNSNIFPFWGQALSPTTAGPLFTSSAAASSYGASQVFDFMKTQVRRNNAFGPAHNTGAGNLRPGDPVWSGYTLSPAGSVSITDDPSGEDYIVIQD